LIKFSRKFKKSALIIPAGINWTYTELEEKVNNLSVELSNLGIGYKDRLAIVHPQDHAFITVFFAALRIGAHLAPLNPAYIAVQNELVKAYNELREEAALKYYNKHYADLLPEQQEKINKLYPQRISEAEPKNYGGGN